MSFTNRILASLATLACVSACASTEPLKTVPYVNLERFMGDWYVIANIPTVLERGAHNAVESYRLNPDGTVATTFTFRDGSFDGERKQYHPRGFVRDETNAIWGMQFVWPVKADYRIVYLDEDYSVTVIGRNRRDYVWIMARQPRISEQRYAAIVEKIGAMGYDLSELQKVPQQW